MISATAVALALAFWAPYNHGEPVCPDGVQIALYAHGDGGITHPDADGWAYLNGGCTINLRADIATEQPQSVQCAIIAHELGHSVFGLPDTAEQGNIMGNTNGILTVPRACEPLTPTYGASRGLADTTPRRKQPSNRNRSRRCSKRRRSSQH